MTGTIKETLPRLDFGEDSYGRFLDDLGSVLTRIGIAARFTRLCREEMRRSGTVSKAALHRITGQLDGMDRGRSSA